MARIRSLNELIQSSQDFLKLAQPLLDTKPGTVSRDLIIEGPSAQLSRLYDEVNQLANLQSLRVAIGQDLDKLGSNYGAVRLSGAPATGAALFTFDTLDADFGISKGQSITAKNGATFTVVNSVVISTVLTSNYKAIAAKNRTDLDFLGISDQYAISILVQAASTGTQGNISKYSLTKTNISGINNVTNVSPFGGGNGAEDDATFRSRILAIFSGSNTGTALGYRNAVLSAGNVIDALVITPGDPLMTRDGTQVKIAPDGTRTIISEGSGGKVDVLVFGSNLQETTDSFLYRDESNTFDPTNSKNDFVIGQIPADVNKTVTRKRIDDLVAGVLPSQPVNNIVSVSGTLSGQNFAEMVVDDLGRVSGNYQLIRDTGAYGGSPWGFDKLHWISNKISDFSEDKTKLAFNNQDALGFSDVLEINTIQQNRIVTNENSTVNPADRTSILLVHSPITSVSRVFNVTTGERYTVANQNPDGSGTINLTGRIVISGKSLPAVSDLLQVDYTWIYTFDPYFDYDNRLNSNNLRTVQDSVDWGFSNEVHREQATLISSGSILQVNVTHPISSVVSVNTYAAEEGNTTLLNLRPAIVVSKVVTNVVSIVRESDSAELWHTTKDDGTFSNTVIFFPTDSSVQLNDKVLITYNAVDVYNATNMGSFNGTIITIVPSSTAVAGTLVECNYLANISVLLPATLLPALPAVRNNNTFNTKTSTGIGNQPTSHLFSNSTIFKNYRIAPTNLALNINGNISPGIITVAGTTLTGVFESIFTVSSAGLKIDLSPAIKQFLQLNSSSVIPSNLRIGKIAKVELITATNGLEYLSTITTYDLQGYHIFDNSFVKSESVADNSLKLTEMILPTTSNNTSNLLTVGARIRVSFYLMNINDAESISFTKSGTLITNKKFAIVSTMAVSTGFTSGSSSSATLTVSNINQPDTKSRYKVFYDYLAPKTNERITIDFNYQKIISDATFSVENTRPINADVLVKAATAVPIDITVNIVVTSDFTNSSTLVIQNVQDAITGTLNATALGTIVDSSDLINAAYTITGIDRVRVVYFNKSNVAGSVLSITAQKNEYLVASTVLVNLETR